MYNKIKLFIKIRRFYEIFGDELGANPCAKWSNMTNDNLYDVLYDLNEVYSSYYRDTDPMCIWLNQLQAQIRAYRKPKSSILPKILIAISTLFILWCAISTIEITSKNLEPNPQYSPYNIWVLFFDKSEPEVAHTRYTAYGRYYTNGTVVTNDGNEWTYTTDTISDRTPTDAMPVWVGFDDNGTPNDITDDVILGLVYDRETAIYDDLETALSDEFELTRDGNNIHIGGTK